MNASIKDSSIGQLVTERPSRSLFFEKLGFDYCCGGKQPLEKACADKGLSVEDVVKDLMQFDTDRSKVREDKDWSKASMTELVDNIFETHHEYLREVFPRLTGLVEKVANVHGSNHPEVVTLSKVFSALRMELEMHIQKEERVLFPYCKEMDTATTMPDFHCGSIQNPINVMLREHDDTGEHLKAMRKLTDNYTPPADACNTYRAMMDGLLELERDIHLHIHKENNILFPSALKKMETLESSGCCHH